MISFGSWFKERDIFMCSALVSGHGLKNEIYSCVARLFSALVSGQGFKNEIYSCVAHLFRVMD